MRIFRLENMGIESAFFLFADASRATTDLASPIGKKLRAELLASESFKVFFYWVK
jgi:hypothetical protein